METRTKKYVVLWVVVSLLVFALDQLFGDPVKQTLTRSYWFGVGLFYAWVMDRGWL